MLPPEFLTRMEALLGAEYADFLAAYDRPLQKGLRLSRRKRLDGQLECLRDPIPWARDGYAYDPESRPGKHPYHEAGLYYLQEPSALAPATLLGPQPGERVLDLCAAPGGKSMAAAMYLGNQGEILSCDVHGGKLPQIELAAERLGVTVVKTMKNDASVFRPEWENAFDAVIADVPCSGLGVIRKKPDIRYKNLSDLEQLPPLQRNIIEQAGRYVRPGGMLLYSTCTILKRENEDVALDFLSAHGEFSPETLHLPQPLEESRTGMLTLYQGIHQCDGFFMCKMRKQL